MATNGTKKSQAQLDQEKKDREEIAAVQRRQHTRRLSTAVQAGYTITGVRLSDPKSGHEHGVVVTFDDDEQREVVAAVKKVLDARK